MDPGERLDFTSVNDNSLTSANKSLNSPHSAFLKQLQENKTLQNNMFNPPEVHSVPGEQRKATVRAAGCKYLSRVTPKTDPTGSVVGDATKEVPCCATAPRCGGQRQGRNCEPLQAKTLT